MYCVEVSGSGGLGFRVCFCPERCFENKSGLSAFAKIGLQVKGNTLV